MSETELIVKQRKKKQIKPLIGPMREEETNEEYSTQDEQPERRIMARKIVIVAEDMVKQQSDQMKLQEDQMQLQQNLLNQRTREMEERMFNARNVLTDSELGNVAKVVLSDQTITHAKGKDTQRHHRKILGGLYHRDEERTTEVEFHRGDGQ